MLVFRFPLPPNLANGRKSWQAKLRQRQAYERACDMLVLTKQLPRIPAAPFDRATIAAHFIVGGMMDDDNAMARAKWSVDWLVKRGYLADDRRKCLTWSGLPTQRVSRDQQLQCVEITLTQIPQ